MDMASVWKRKVLSSRTGGRVASSPSSDEPCSLPVPVRASPCLLLPQNNVLSSCPAQNPPLISTIPPVLLIYLSSATTLHVIPTNALPQGLTFLLHRSLFPFFWRYASLRFPSREPALTHQNTSLPGFCPPHNYLPVILLRHPT